MSIVPRLGRYPLLSVRYWVVSLASLAVFAPLARSQAAGGPSQIPAAPRPEAVRDHAAAIFGQLPIRFEKNQGQVDANVKFVSRNGAYSVLLAPNEAVLALDYRKTHKKGTRQSSRATLHLRLVNANSNPPIIGIEELAAKSNYFIGNDPKRWLTKIANYSRVRYEQVYPGVNLDYYGNQRGLEYDFVLAPNADPSRIRFEVTGERSAPASVRLAKNGDLLITVSGQGVRLKRPFVYQPADAASGAKTEIPGSFVLETNSRVSFQLGAYDRSRQVIIDPAIVYSTYLGGSNSSVGLSVATYADPVTSHVYAYFAGTTCDADFPTRNALQSSISAGCSYGQGQAFVAKIDTSTSADASLLWSTYFGGTDLTGSAVAIAADAAGSVYVTGNTNSASFPTVNAFQSTRRTPTSSVYYPATNGNTFVSKISAGGSTLLYSTYFGGSTSENAHAIALDPAGHVYIAGSTNSPDLSTLNAYQPALRSQVTEGFIAIFDPTRSGMSSLLYATYLGGSNPDHKGYGDSILGLAVDSAGNVNVGGYAQSSDFPTTPTGFQPTFPVGVVSTFQGSMSFFARLNPFAPPASQLVYSTFLGPAGNGGLGGIAGVALDSAANAFVVGNGVYGQVPVTQGSYQGPGDPGSAVGFVAKINPSKQGAASLIYCASFLMAATGGGANVTGIAVDSNGEAFVVGDSTSGLPLVNPAHNSSNGVFQSLDGGTSWTVLSNGMTRSARISALAIDTTSSPRILYAGTLFGTVYTSSDGGLSWKQGLQLPSNDNSYFCSVEGSRSCVFALAVDPSNSSTVYAGTSSGVYKSTDRGASWNPLNSGLSNAAAENVAALQFDNGTLYAGALDGLYKLASGSSTWTTTTVTSPVFVIAVDPKTNPHSIYTIPSLGYGTLASKSLDGGQTWIPFATPCDELSYLAVDIGTSPSSLYVTGDIFNACNSNYVSRDQGSTWNVLGAIPGDYAATDPLLGSVMILDATQSPSTIFVKGAGGVVKSMDGGTTWTPLVPAGNAFGTIALDSGTGSFGLPSTLYAATGSSRAETFVLELDASGSTLLFSSYVSGIFGDESTHGNGIALDQNSNIYVAGGTNTTYFPVVNGIAAHPILYSAAFFMEIGSQSLPTSTSGPVSKQLGVPNGTLTVSLPNITGSMTISAPTLAVTALSASDTANFSLSSNLGAYDISTTATFSASTANPVTICFQAQTVNDPTTFAGLRLIHIVNGNPVDSTSSHDFISRTVCGSVTSLSPFVLIDGVPKVNWPAPAGIIHGSQISSAQLNATASVPGTFTYTPAAGTVLAPGQQTLSVTFTPANQALYSSVTKTVPIQVSYSTGSCNGEVGHSVLQPINSDGTSVFKLGSTVPTKFRVCDANGNSVGLAGTVVSYTLTGAGSTSSLAVDEDVYSTSADSAFRWDSTGKQWIFNQATGKSNPSLSQTNTVYRFQITLKDGSVIQFKYGVK